MSNLAPVPASHVLLNAETQFLIGRFRVPTAQIQPHPNQRELSEAWVDSLLQRFVDVGIERVAFPIKVLLKNPNQLDALRLVLQNNNCGDVPELPSEVLTLVYHGQHRVAACMRMIDENERWWFAEVYQPALESSYPAEFLTLMHMGNEDEHRLSTSDSDRFLVMHRLYRMHRDQVIATDVFQANRSRLARAVAKDATRQGLTNLLASQDLAEAVARALQYPWLRSSFNASTWGKKLVKGRFFMLAACLVDEMVEQSRLLIDSRTDVSNKPFSLPSQSCTWSQLEVGVKKKDHPWNELHGGAAAALIRVQSRNPDFTTFLNPSGSDGWTLPRTVLLPSVLTSDNVFSIFKEMYNLAQHLIHMTAGPKHLAKYMHNSPHHEDEDHPVGIFSWVLKEKFAGKPSNFPHKIVLGLWQHLEVLTDDLDKAKISVASETAKPAYKLLIQRSKPWWELLRMFKMSKLPGMDLTVPKVFHQDLPPTDNRLLLAIRNKNQTLASSQPQPGPPSSSGVEKCNTTRDQARSPSLTVEEPGTSTAALTDTITNEHLEVFSNSQPQESYSGKRKQIDEDEVQQPLKSRRSERLHANREDQISTAIATTTTSALSTAQDSMNHLWTQGTVQQQLVQLSEIMPEIDSADAQALQKLLSSLLEMRGTSYLGRVVVALSEKIPILVQRAKKAEQVARDAEIDWEHSQAMEQVEAQL
ncbi:hypothetical protein FRC09_018608 [Ceratobasidium sp. 395]|nr:hypothetical protein FRC09_018608 [Ceratobasidium sp. 395]